MFVYIIDRDGELDVFESRSDAEEAQEILGGAEHYPILEQVTFAPTEDETAHMLTSTRAFLNTLRADRS